MKSQNFTKPFLFAIDGKCGSGKSTLAQVLSEKLHAPVISLDDFFLPLELRTPERKLSPGGNVHYERFISEVLEPLRAGREVRYGVFDCSQMKIRSYKTLPLSDCYIIEGSYSMRPDFLSFYNMALLLGCTEEIQKDRIAKRNGPEGLKMFLEQWIPLENHYFTDLYGDYAPNEDHLFYIC